MNPLPRLTLVVPLLMGCGASSTAVTTPSPPPPPSLLAPPSHTVPSAPLENECPSSGGLSIEGQLGTLPQPRVRRALQEAEPRLSACYTARLEAMPCLAGRAGFKLRVGTDGGVRWVIPHASTVGDREVEGCMRDVLASLSFGRPCGGEAEVTWSMEFDAGPDARPPTHWPTTRVDTALAQSRTALHRCRNGLAGSVRVTLYAAPNGTVAAAGASIDTPELAPVAECALGIIRGWRLPSPGSWYARTSFDLP